MSNYYNQTPPGQYPQPHYGPVPPQRKSRTVMWVIIGVSLAVVLMCGGVVALVFVGLNVVEAEVADLVRDHPVIREHIGEIQEIDLDFTASGARSDNDEFVYNITGSKGNGVLIAKTITDDDGTEQLIHATLRLPNGETVVLEPEGFGNRF